MTRDRLEEAERNFGKGDHVTLLYVLKNDRQDVLLIYKKKGFGSGLYNGPGGKVEEGETPEEAAIRETNEETGVTPINPEKLGLIEFVFEGDPFHCCHVFRTSEYEGSIRGSEEARPKWFLVENVPYHQMWPDDKYWMPCIFDGHEFHATFWFDHNDEIKKWEINGEAQ